MSIQLTRRGELVSQGIDMLLDLFKMVYWQNLFPRTMATALSGGAQFEVHSKEEILLKCMAADYKDCRLNAYPTRGKPDIDLGLLAPSILFIDIDKGDRTEEQLVIILEETLAKIKEELSISPLVLWTGNGYHIYIGLKVAPFYRFPKLMDQCRELGSEPNTQFLKFVGPYFTNDRSDPERDRGISPLSALLRIPYSLNTKCLKPELEPVVKIVQRHSDMPASLPDDLFLDFRAHINHKWISKSIEFQEDKSKDSGAGGNDYDDVDDGQYHGKIGWIEYLLTKPISKNRYQCLFHIIGPYLRNTLQLSDLEAKGRMVQWLNLCNQKSRVLKKETKLRGVLSGSRKFKPWKLETLERENEETDFEYQEIVDIAHEYCKSRDYEEDEEDEDFEEDEEDEDFEDE
jgi:hypothetical protein